MGTTLGTRGLAKKKSVPKKQQTRQHGMTTASVCSKITHSQWKGFVGKLLLTPKGRGPADTNLILMSSGFEFEWHTNKLSICLIVISALCTCFRALLSWASLYIYKGKPLHIHNIQKNTCTKHQYTNLYFCQCFSFPLFVVGFVNSWVSLLGIYTNVAGHFYATCTYEECQSYKMHIMLIYQYPNGVEIGAQP